MFGKHRAPALPLSLSVSLSLSLSLSLVSLAGCTPAETETDPVDTTTTTTATDTPDTISDVRGDRYCEVLLGHIQGALIQIDVYNTYGLNDCPDDAWKAIDGPTIKADTNADVVLLNGPRYWTMDRFEASKLVDPTIATFGGIEMRLAGTLELQIADVMGGETAYVPRTVARTTSWVYEAGKPVYELTDPAGHIYDMQSYSTQQVPQTEASLADLAQQLTLPAGWSFKSRILDADLTVTAVDGLATVVQDDRANTYQLSAQ